MKKSVLMIPAVVAFMAGSAFAQTSPPDFEEADRDGDGVLSREEMEQAFPDLDIPNLNQRDEVGQNEVRAALPNVDFDAGDDGEIGEEEYDQIVEAYEERQERMRDQPGATGTGTSPGATGTSPGARDTGPGATGTGASQPGQPGQQSPGTGATGTGTGTSPGTSPGASPGQQPGGATGGAGGASQPGQQPGQGN